MKVKRTKDKGVICSTPKKKCTFKLFVENQCRSLPVKYPFLTATQIKNKAVELWNQLSPEEKGVPLTPYRHRKTLRTPSDGKPGKFFSRIQEETGESVFPENQLTPPGSPIRFQGGEKKYNAGAAIHPNIEVVSSHLPDGHPEHGILKKGDVKRKSKHHVSFCEKVSKLDVSDQAECFENREPKNSADSRLDKLLTDHFGGDDSTLPDIVSVFPENLYQRRSRHDSITEIGKSPLNNSVQLKTYTKDKFPLESCKGGLTNVTKSDKSRYANGTSEKKKSKRLKWGVLTRRKANVIASEMQQNAFRKCEGFMVKEGKAEKALDVYKFENSNDDVEKSTKRFSLQQKNGEKNAKETQKISFEFAGTPRKKKKYLKNECSKGATEISFNQSGTLLIDDIEGTPKKELVQRRKRSVRDIGQNVVCILRKRNKKADKTHTNDLEKDGYRRSPGFSKVHKKQKVKSDITSKGAKSPKILKTGTQSERKSSKNLQETPRRKSLAIVPKKAKMNVTRESLPTEDPFAIENIDTSSTSGSSMSDTSLKVDNDSMNIDLNNNGNLEIVASDAQSQIDSKVIDHSSNDQTFTKKRKNSSGSPKQAGKYSLRYRSPFKELNHGLKRPCYYNDATTSQVSGDSEQPEDVYDMDISEPNSPEKKKCKSSTSEKRQSTNKCNKNKNIPSRNLASMIASKCKGVFKNHFSKKGKYEINSNAISDVTGEENELIENGGAIGEIESSQESSQRSFYSVESSDESECERDNQLALLNYELGNPLQEAPSGYTKQNTNDMPDDQRDAETMETGSQHRIADEKDGGKENCEERDASAKGAEYAEDSCHLIKAGVEILEETMKTRLNSEIDCTRGICADKESEEIIPNKDSRPSVEKSVICEEPVATVSVSDQVCEVSTTSKEISAMKLLDNSEYGLDDRRRDLDQPKSEMHQVLTKVKDVKAKLKSPKKKLISDGYTQECAIGGGDMENSTILDSQEMFASTGDGIADMESKEFDNNNIPCVDVKQSCLTEHNNNSVAVIDEHDKIHPVSESIESSVLHVEQASGKDEAESCVSRKGRTGYSVTPLSGVCKVQELITPLNADGIVEMTMKHVTKAPQKQKVTTETSNEAPEVHTKSTKAKKCLENQVPINNTNDGNKLNVDVETLVTTDTNAQDDVDELEPSKSNDMEIMDEKSALSEHDECSLEKSESEADNGEVHAFLKLSLTCHMDLLQDIEENQAGREFLQSQGELTVQKTLRNLRNIVNSSTVSGASFEGEGSFMEPVCSLSVSPALSGVTKLDIGMTPNIGISNIEREKAESSLENDQNEAISSNYPMNNDVKESPGLIQNKSKCNLDMERSNLKDFPLAAMNDASDRCLADVEVKNDRIAEVVSYLNDSVKHAEKLGEIHDSSSSRIEMNKNMTLEEDVPVYKRVLSLNQERSLLDLFDDPKTSTNTSNIVSRSTSAGTESQHNADLLSEIENSGAMFW